MIVLNDKDRWLKQKSYLHITPTIDVFKRKTELKRKIKNREFVSRYAFFPLIHAVLKDRRFKKVQDIPGKRAHSYWKRNGNGQRKKETNVKYRPLHYATHFDSLIYSYYAQILQEKYRSKLSQLGAVNNCITAYRKIPINEGSLKGKSTIHFAKEVFKEIIDRNNFHEDSVAVLTFDLKSFFSTLNHDYLEARICEVLGVEFLPPDYKNVFRATTKFSYILRDELRLQEKAGKRRVGFDEKKLSHIRKTQGRKCFFESPKDFRRQLKEKKIRIYTQQFSRNGISMGIPQGLPNSAVFANIYLLQFDINLYNRIIKDYGGFYRRYSDDIIVIVEKSKIEEIKSFVYKEIELACLECSKEKTEEFIFDKIVFNKNGNYRLASTKLEDGKLLESNPLVYLGFEFRGYSTLIKASNVSKFYRRMIYAVKRKARRVESHIKRDPTAQRAIFINQLRPIFLNYSLQKKPKNRKHIKFVENKRGEFDVIYNEKSGRFTTNYYSYIRRVVNIMEDERIKKQFRKVKRTLYAAIKQHLKDM